MARKQDTKEDKKNLTLINGVWYFRLMVNGAVVKQSLHTSSLEKARRLRDEMRLSFVGRMDEKKRLEQVERQLAGIEAEEEREKKSPLKGTLLINAFKLFENDPARRSCKKEQLENHRTNWTKFLKWLALNHPEIMYCRQVTRSIGQEWAADLLKSVRATNTYNRHVSSVRYVFTSLMGYDEELKNPMERIHQRQDKDCQSKEAFTDEELKAIFSSPYKEFRMLSAVGLYTTLRLGSARKLTWEQFDDSLTYLTAIHDKTGADASQRIADELREILQEVPKAARHGLMFPTFAAKSKSNACQLMQNCLSLCGIVTKKSIEGLNGKTRTVCIKGFHSFRHTGITRALRNGAGVAQTRQLAGHASERMQKRYTHFNADDAGDAAARIGRVI
jgi:integrase